VKGYVKTMEIKKNVSLKNKNEFRTGGVAIEYAAPTTKRELYETLANAKNIDVEILGGGANILISDKGYDGLIIKPRLENISYNAHENSMTAGSGVSIQKCIDWALDNNLIGLEEFSGIPGTIGGAVYMNIHYFSFFISDYFLRGTVINKKTLVIKAVTREWFSFGYDQSKLQNKEYLLIDATFKITKSDPIKTAYTMGRRDEIIRHRNSRYPTSHTCGSFFRNFHDYELETVVGKKLPFVAYYLDKLGIKGELSVGGATVSSKHANMIVNNGNATSSDIVNLARKMQEMVFERFSIVPQSECQFIGFDSYPLHKDLVKPRLSKFSHDIQPSSES
jgi:UDP-N-acetylmuramate dehydrogenase